MLKNTRLYLMIVFALTCAAPTFAAGEPSIGQVYEAANTGHLDQAQQMMSQVLRDHPQSARAHYVAAEVYARAGNTTQARQELDTAQTLRPGLPFARPESVQALQAQLATQGQSVRKGTHLAQTRAAFPLRTVLLVLGGLCLLWLIMRRRTPVGAAYPQYPGAAPSGAPVNYGGPGVAPGMGSGIGGALASGLAVGAGVVAGEELAHHFLGGDRRAGVVPANSEEPVVPDNSAMGGADFGVSDASSWDDSSGGGGGDWS